MKNFLLGMLFGIILTTIGVDGLFRWVDVGVTKTQEIVSKMDTVV